MTAALLCEVFDEPRWTVRPWRAGVDYRADLVVDAVGEIVGVVRTPHHEILPTDYEGTVDFGDVLQKEVGVLALLRAHGVPAPRVLGWAKRQRPQGTSWMLLEYIAHDAEPDLTPTVQRELGRIAARIHAIRPDESASVDIVATEGWAQYMQDRLALRLKAAAQHCEQQLPLQPVLARVAELLEPRAAEANALLHLDLRPSNICVRDGRIVAVIDVSNAMVGDPLLELARIRSYGLLTPAFLAGYGITAAELDIAADVLDVYELDIAALLTVVARDEIDDPELFRTSRARVVELCVRLAP